MIDPSASIVPSVPHQWCVVLAASPGVPGWVWFVAGAVVAGVVVGGLAYRATRARAKSVTAALEQLSQRGSFDSIALAADALPDTWADAANALRRAARTLGEREAEHIGRLRDLEAILQSTTAGFIAVDPQQRVLHLNPAASTLLGIATTEVRGRLLQEITRHAELNRFLAMALSLNKGLEGDCVLQTTPPRHVHAVSEPLRDFSGRPVGMLISLQDVTRMRRLESLRSDFVANVSHELRTPITSIKGYVETLLQVGSGDPAQVRKFLEIVHRNTVRLSTLVEDLLSLASLEQTELADRSELATGSVDPATIVQTVVELLGPVAEARRITVRTRVEPGLRVVVNRVLAEQALSNLVSNAIRYAGEGTDVDIDVHRTGGVIAFDVTDRGPGIASMHLDRIFERFYRVDKARSSARGGTGLGLAIVKHIAQVHGGSVDVQSEVGVGSTFRLLFPSPPIPAAVDHRSAPAAT
jgi:two-component system phosphate regulon sensor histidine kinase PhoR